jgi:hypothetical protein
MMNVKLNRQVDIIVIKIKRRSLRKWCLAVFLAFCMSAMVVQTANRDSPSKGIVLDANFDVREHQKSDSASENKKKLLHNLTLEKLLELLDSNMAR